MDAFTIEIPEETLADLRARLERARWPELFALEDVETLVDRWRDGFDWRAREAELNTFPQFRARVDDTLLHFVHVRSGGIPILLVHGWPSTFYEYLKILPLLRDEFDVVVPSLPGYGFSQPLPRGEFRRTPELLARLMTDLGYERFGAYGGDIGGMVVNRLALEVPERLVGLATSFPAEPHLDPPLTDAERDVIASRRRRVELRRDVYTDLGRWYPAEIALALDDSPAALAAWVGRFWREWSEGFETEDLLTTLTLYWTTQTIGSSLLPYDDWALGTAGQPQMWAERPEVPTGIDSKPLARDERIAVPAAILLFSLARLPREWVERAYNDVRRFTVMPRGGHFGALEAPQLLADELHAFFAPLR